MSPTSARAPNTMPTIAPVDKAFDSVDELVDSDDVGDVGDEEDTGDTDDEGEGIVDVITYAVGVGVGGRVGGGGVGFKMIVFPLSSALTTYNP